MMLKRHFFLFDRKPSVIYQGLALLQQSNNWVKDVKVYDMIGKVIWENNTPLGNLFNIDISPYSPGIYYVRAINEAGEIDLKKLIKQ